MKATFDVRLFDEHCNPLTKVEVQVSYGTSFVLDGSRWANGQTARTSAEGLATFPYRIPYSFVVLHCRGKTHGPFAVEPGDTIALVL